MGTLQDLNRERAQKAMECINKGLGKLGKDDHKKLQSYCQSVSTYIRVNGIVNTIAFIDKKRKGHSEENAKSECKIWNEIYEGLENWYVEKFNKKEKLEKGLLQKLIYIEERNDYRKVTKELLEFSGWLKKMAEAMIDIPKDENKN